MRSTATITQKQKSRLKSDLKQKQIVLSHKGSKGKSLSFLMVIECLFIVLIMSQLNNQIPLLFLTGMHQDVPIYSLKVELDKLFESVI